MYPNNKVFTMDDLGISRYKAAKTTYSGIC